VGPRASLYAVAEKKFHNSPFRKIKHDCPSRSLLYEKMRDKTSYTVALNLCFANSFVVYAYGSFILGDTFMGSITPLRE